MTNKQEEIIKRKQKGKVYTPEYLVNIILNSGFYIKGNINKKHVIDNSCGDGQFLVNIVERYCDDFLSSSKDLNELKKQLEMYIHGIEIDLVELEKCKKRCDEITKKYGIQKVNWDFLNKNTLEVEQYDSKMDFVVGDPPYVRVHNLNTNFQKVKKHLFNQTGMTDLFITFYEIGIKMLNKNGILCYITPSSFFTSVAGKNLRTFLIKNNLINSVCDLKHFHPFNASTYTTIVCLKKNKDNKEINYLEFSAEKLEPFFVCKLKEEDFFIKNNFYFSNLSNLKILKNILLTNNTTDISVKNGFATLADDAFIKEFDFDSSFIIPVLKASRGKWTKIIYPYTRDNQIVLEEELKKNQCYIVIY